MRERATVLIVQDEKVLMMWRNKQGRIYHTFIGGGIEVGETPEAAAIREAKEETNLDVVLRPKLWVETNEERSFVDHGFLVTEFSGDLCLGEGPESESASGENVYRHVWVPLLEVPDLTVFPVGLGVERITAVIELLKR